MANPASYGNLALPPLRNKGWTRPYSGKPMVNKAPYYWGAVFLPGVREAELVGWGSSISKVYNPTNEARKISENLPSFLGKAK